MMPLREAMPVRVMKPTSEAMLNVPPVSSTATTEPMRASGMLSIIWPTMQRGLEVRVKHQEDAGQREQAQPQNLLRGRLLALKLPPVGEVVARGQLAPAG